MSEANRLLRRTIIDKRMFSGKDSRDLASAAITKKFLAMHCFASCKNIALYFPVRGEVNTLDIINHAWYNAISCYLPVVNDEGAQPLSFLKYTRNTALQANQYDILEPKPGSLELCPRDFDIVVFPIIAFDEQCNRLGSGCGYYDKAFSFARNNISHGSASTIKPILVGLAYEFQKLEFDFYDHDVQLDIVLSEKNTYISDKFKAMHGNVL